MHETAADIEEMQALLDRSYESAGAHLRDITTPERRLSATQVSERLQGMCLLVLATTSDAGKPVTGAVDGIFYRGHFYFSSSPDSVRFRHIAKRPNVSATHLPGEEMQVNVRGRAAKIDHKDPSEAGFRETLLGIYTPRYGADWEQWVDSGPVYARIDADRMYTFQMNP